LGSCNNEYIIDYPEIPAGRVILSKENKDSISNILKKKFIEYGSHQFVNECLNRGRTTISDLVIWRSDIDESGDMINFRFKISGTIEYFNLRSNIKIINFIYEGKGLYFKSSNGDFDVIYNLVNKKAVNLKEKPN
jgi:hypothetical protein